MSELTKSQNEILEILKKIKYPGYSRDIVSFGMVKEVIVEDHTLSIVLKMEGVEERIAVGIREYTTDILKAESGFDTVHVDVENVAAPESCQHEGGHPEETPAPEALKGIDKVIAVSSGKGGVGKSTVAVNLAVMAAKKGYKVGIVDADIYGPSLPTLMGKDLRPGGTDEGIIPVEKHGIKGMSIGFLIESGQPLIWRGPMLNQALAQIIENTLWGELDFLFIDLPPGTGDVQISLSQKYKIDGAVVVTTPQNLALEDVRRGAGMFQRTEVPVMGIIENMSYYRCPCCSDVSHPFGEGGGKQEAEELGMPLLGTLPMDPKTLQYADKGEPIVVAEPDSESAKAYGDLWQAVQNRLKEMV